MHRYLLLAVLLFAALIFAMWMWPERFFCDGSEPKGMTIGIRITGCPGPRR